MKRYLWPALLALLGLTSLGLYLYAARLGDLRLHSIRFESTFAVLFVVYFAAIGLALKVRPDRRTTLAVVLGFAVLFRLALLFSAPTLSSDMYRYVWDGKVQIARVNPYLVRPDSPTLASLRDKAIYENMDFKDSKTVYQPAAQIFFLAVALVYPNSVLAMKIAFVLLDLGSIWLVLAILKRLKLDSSRVLIYAWSPLVLFEISHSAHVDALIVFLLLAAILSRLDEKPVRAGVLLGLAIATKFYPAVLAPAFVKRREWRLPLALVVTLLLVYLPYRRAGLWFFAVFRTVANATQFNAGLRHFLGRALETVTKNPDPILIAVFALALAGGAVWALVRKERSPSDFIFKLMVLGGLYVVFALLLAPWYMLFFVPLLCFSISPAFLYLSGSVALSYFFYSQEPWHLPDWVRYLEYLPFYALLAGEIASRRIRFSRRTSP